MKRTLQLGMIFRFETSDSVQLISALERCLDAVDSVGLACQWSFPLHTLFKDSSQRADRVIDRLRERTDDQTAPLGFTGAYHLLLSSEELAKELEWSRENPWGEDTRTVLGSDPAVLFPFSLDPLRGHASGIYGEGGRFLVADASGETVYVVSGERFNSIPAISLSRLEYKVLAGSLHKLYRRKELQYVVLVLDGLGTTPGRLTPLLETLSQRWIRRSRVQVVALSEILSSLSEGEGDIRSLVSRMDLIPVDPISRMIRAKAATRKSTRNADESMKRRLERLTARDPDEGRDVSDELPKHKKRNLVADMSGEVTLTEGDLSVDFVAGRMAGIRRGDREMLVGQPASGRLVHDGRSMEFSTVSAFSFVGRTSRGLQVTQRLHGERVVTPGEIVGDYSFEDGQEDLLVSITVAYPELRDIEWIDQYALFEVPLFSVGRGGEVEVEGEYPDGARYSLRLGPTSRPVQLCGVHFRFSSGGRVLHFHFPPAPGNLPEVLPVCFRRDDTGHLFYVNPRGSYSRMSVSTFAGVTEQFHFSVGAEASRETESVPEAPSLR